MLYCNWDMAGDRCNYFPFWAIFCHFTPLTAQKIKISQKWKNSWRYHHFTRVPKIMIRWCTVPEIWCTTYGRTERRTDGKTDTQRWMPHLKKVFETSGKFLKIYWEYHRKILKILKKGFFLSQVVTWTFPRNELF